MTVEQYRRAYEALMRDDRLTPSERDDVIAHTLGEYRRPKNIGEARRVISELQNAIKRARSEVPY